MRGTSRHSLYASSVGFSLVEVALTLGLVGTVTLVSAHLLTSTQSSVSQAQLFWLTDIRDTAMVQVRNDLAWQRSIADPRNGTNFNCVLNPRVDCAPTAARGLIPLYLTDSAGTLVVGAADPTQGGDGLTYAGARCAGFSTTNGSDQCPFRYNLFWRAKCQTSPCFKPQIEVVGRLDYSPARTSNELAIRTEKFGFTAMRNDGSDLKASCTALGGTFDGVTCNPARMPVPTICPANRPFVGGFDSNGVAICKRISAAPCPVDQYIGRVDFNPGTGQYTYSCFSACGTAGPVVTVGTL